MREGVVVVVQRDGEFLVIRRAAHILAGGAWCFVGGAIEPGESQAEAVVREFAEEVSGSVSPVRKVWELSLPANRLVLHWWSADLLAGDLAANPQEVDELRWCSLAELRRLPNVLASNLAFVEALEAGRIALA